METVNSRTVFENLKMGQWLDTFNGTFVVTEPYNDTQGAIRAAEIIFNNIKDNPCAVPFIVGDSFYKKYEDIHGALIME